jgi:transposase
MNRDALAQLSKEDLITLVLAQAAAIETLTKRVAELEVQLGQPPKTPSNSSVPPSQGYKANGSAKRKTKRKAHPGAHRPLHPKPTRCLEVLAAQTPCHTYDRIEIPEIVPDVTRVTLHGGICPCCARRFKAPPPAGLEPGSPFGPNLRAFVLYLRFGQAIPFERLARLMQDLCGLEISEGALANTLAQSAAAFASQTEAIRARLLAGTVLESDETSARVGKQTFWNWVFHHADSACFVIRPSRGKQVVKEFLGEVRPNFWISDRLAAQMGWATAGHQVCLVHLMRDISMPSMAATRLSHRPSSTCSRAPFASAAEDQSSPTARSEPISRRSKPSSITSWPSRPGRPVAKNSAPSLRSIEPTSSSS